MNGGFSKKVSSPEYPNLNWKPKQISSKSKKIKKVKKKGHIHVYSKKTGECYRCKENISRL